MTFLTNLYCKVEHKKDKSKEINQLVKKHKSDQQQTLDNSKKFLHGNNVTQQGQQLEQEDYFNNIMKISPPKPVYYNTCVQIKVPVENIFGKKLKIESKPFKICNKIFHHKRNVAFRQINSTVKISPKTSIFNQNDQIFNFKNKASTIYVNPQTQIFKFQNKASAIHVNSPPKIFNFKNKASTIHVNSPQKIFNFKNKTNTMEENYGIFTMKRKNNKFNYNDGILNLPKKYTEIEINNATCTIKKTSVEKS